MAAVALSAVLLWVRSRPSTLPGFTRTTGQNFLIVTIDTLRADALGVYGGSAATPALDALARDGVRFSFAHAHAVVTLPSHASIMTGRYPFEHGVRDNAGFRLEEAEVTIAELAREKGFATGAFVGAFPLDRRFGLAQGFDEYDDVGGRMAAPAEFSMAERRAEDVVSRARLWIERQVKPWLVWVHVFDPHAPYAAPSPFDNAYAADSYAGEVAYVDYALGPLLQQARGSDRPTTILITSDHGEGLGQHGETTHGTFAYESTLRVPLILAQVGGDRRPRVRDTVSDAPVSHVDILPTIAGLIDASTPEGLPGRSLMTRGDEPGGRPVYFEAMTPMLSRGWAPLRGTLEGREKYIDLPIAEIYDLSTDPREERNLAPSMNARLGALAARLQSLGASLPGEQTEETGEARARLESLGYLSGSTPRKARYTLDDDPKRLIDVDRMIIEGIELKRSGRIREAIEVYQRVIERRPDMNLAYRWLAFVQWDSGMRAAAIDSLRAALKQNGPDMAVETRLGTYLAETGAHGEAVTVLERIAVAEPDNTEALNALGIAYARAGRHDNALRAFRQILAVNPRDVFALENIGAVHLSRGDTAAAGDAFARAVEADARSSRAHAGLGVVALRTGRRDEAIRHWTTAVAIDRTNFDALFNLASELVNAGRMAEARPYLEQFVATAPPTLYGPDVERFRQLLQGGVR